MPKSVKPPIERTIAEMWEIYSRNVIPSHVPRSKIRTLKFSFYAGVSYVLDVVAAIGEDDISVDKGVETLQRLHDELAVFVMQEDSLLKPRN